MSARESQVRSAERRPSQDHKPSLRVVRRKKAQRLIVRGKERRRAPVMIGGAIVIVALVFGILLEQVVLAQSAFHLTETRSRLVEAEERHEGLLRTSAWLESPARIERFARQELGMVDADTSSVQYIMADIQPSDMSGDSDPGGIASAAEDAGTGTALGGGTP